MSSEARPISPSHFAAALVDLPVENLYTKAAEIRNSIAHLEKSNRELEEYSQSVGGDADCVAAAQENEQVIQRMNRRIDLIKTEAERRGQKWHGDGAMNGETAGEVAAGGRLSDEEPARQGEGRTTEEEDAEDDGVHL